MKNIAKIQPVSFCLLCLCLFPLLLAVMWSAAAQAPTVTAEQYQHAEKFLSSSVTPLVLHAAVHPNWLPDGRFWYRDNLADNAAEFVLVDPQKAARTPAFDHARLAAALSAANSQAYSGDKLPFRTFEYSADGRDVTFSVGEKRFRCDTAGSKCTVQEKGENAAGRESRAAMPPGMERMGTFARKDSPSPDGKHTVFLRNDNLWLREIPGGQETQLTFDGVRDFGYATDNAGWTHSDRPIVLWSPDSRKIATYQQDQRSVGEMYLVDTRVGHSNLQAWKYPLPGDPNIITIQRVIVHLDGPRTVRLKMPPDARRGTVTDDIKVRGGDLDDAQWSADSSQLAFVSSSRDHKVATLRLASAESGEVRDVFQEKVDTYFESGADHSSWMFLPSSQEFIWFSQRENWGHLYLHDLAGGRLKNPITRGEGNVNQLLRVDEKTRTAFFIGQGREPGRDPYFRHFYSVALDGSGLRLLTPEDANHEITLSPDGSCFLDSYSKPDVPPVTVLRNRQGKELLTLARADIAPLVAMGWKPPIPFTVKARDKSTDLYGLLFRPTSFDPARTYPIVNQVYPGPQTGSVGSRSFSAARGDTQALAELGFVVVQLDAMGTPGRSRKFQEISYGNLGDNGLPDQVAGMQQLAERFSWIDIDRAGIWGHSGGGFATAGAMFRYPDFFKVGVSQAGNHDNRNYEDDWGEKWQGLLESKSDGTGNYDNQANQLVARNLKGKLLLAHGTMDDNVPPYNTLLVVNELIKANKDFDLLLFPNRGHGFGSEPYMMRRRWDYFVRHLLGAEPPKEYQIRTAPMRPMPPM